MKITCFRGKTRRIRAPRKNPTPFWLTCLACFCVCVCVCVFCWTWSFISHQTRKRPRMMNLPTCGMAHALIQAAIWQKYFVKHHRNGSWWLVRRVPRWWPWNHEKRPLRRSGRCSTRMQAHLKMHSWDLWVRDTCLAILRTCPFWVKVKWPFQRLLVPPK